MKSDDLVVKHNALTNAGYSLGLVEQRLILMAIVIIREHTHNMELDHIVFDKPIRITADSYIKTFGVNHSTAYEALKDACKSLFARQFSYQEPRERGIAHKTTRWVSDIAYIDNSATVEFTFAPAVFPLITYLKEQFTQYEVGQVSALSSTYAIRLYELLIQWRKTRKTPVFDLADFRKKLGVGENKYQRMGQFKEKVLDIAIDQINKHTDITVSYEQHKEGKVITGFSFTFKFKKITKLQDQATPNPLLGTEEYVYPMPLAVPDTQAERSEFLSKFNGFIQQAKLLKTPIDQLASAKDLEKFKEYGFMK